MEQSDHSANDKNLCTDSDEIRIKRLENANQCDPRINQFGVFASDDVGMFHWYASEENLRAAIARDMVVFKTDDDRHDSEIEAFEILNRYPNEALFSEACLEELKDWFLPETNFQWMGTFSDICNNNNAFCVELREEFRETALDEEEVDAINAPSLGRPIEIENMQEFSEFLNTYGY